MSDRDSNQTWLHRPVEGAASAGTDNLVNRLGGLGNGRMVVDVTAIMRFSAEMGAYTAELAQRARDGIYGPVSGGAGYLFGSKLRSSLLFHDIHNRALERFLKHAGEMGMSAMAFSMASQAAAVEYINADGDGAINIDSVYGNELKKGQHTLFQQGENGTELTDAAKTPERKAADARAEREAQRQRTEIEKILQSSRETSHAKRSPSHPSAPDVAAPVSEDQPNLPGSGRMGKNWSMPDNGKQRFDQDAGGITISRDDEGVELM